MKFPIREVDELEVTVLVANDSGWGYGLRGTHGVALLVRTRYRDQWSTILLDVGPDADLLLNNMEKLGIAPSEVDSIVLSHNHYDHAGGLVGTVEAIGRQGIPIVTHPAAFRTSFVPGQALRVIDRGCVPARLGTHGGGARRLHIGNRGPRDRRTDGCKLKGRDRRRYLA